jgi:antitoxin HicB
LLGYPIELTPDDNGTVLVICPDLPEVATFAADEAEAPSLAVNAIEEALAHRMANREEIPPASVAAGVERMLDLNQRTSLPQIEAAFHASGKRFALEV